MVMKGSTMVPLRLMSITVDSSQVLGDLVSNAPKVDVPVIMSTNRWMPGASS